ncbi:c-type cytochrome [uncultured Paludibaculum sp.]|uniref:c-type cytochrome n=1 Tax=uncultured Paludibaculum sp. TaxID=1765020 RepID=UPI002AAB4FAC|nr:c-type cytochrome [uncultured Paludibaculum sp.]
MNNLVLPPVPRDLPLPLPVPESLLQFLVVPVFLVHILFVNLTVGASLLTVIFEYIGLTRPRYDRLARVVCETITINKSLAVVLGIAPLLMLNLLYTAQFYAANALTGHAWVLLIPLVTTAFLLSYLHQYTWDHWLGRRKARHLLTGAAAALLFLFIPLIFLSNVNLMLLPEHWREAPGFFGSLQFGNVFPRYLHFLAASLALTSLYLAGRLGWRSYPLEGRLHGFRPAELVRLFYACAFLVTAAQLAFGPLLLFTLNWSHVNGSLLAVIATALLCVTPALYLLGRELRSGAPRIGVRYAVIVASLSVTILGMGIGRHLYREAAVARQRTLIAQRTAEFNGIEMATQMRLRTGLGAGESTLGPRSGKAVYDQICSNCHQLHEAANAPALTEIYSLYHANPAGIVTWARNPGKKRPQYNAMPSMGHLEDEELRRVAAYMLQLGAPAAKPQQ